MSNYICVVLYLNVWVCESIFVYYLRVFTCMGVCVNMGTFASMCFVWVCVVKCYDY